jgi:hypothetical protein
LKTGNLLENSAAKSARNGEIALNWNVSGTGNLLAATICRFDLSGSGRT